MRRDPSEKAEKESGVDLVIFGLEEHSILQREVSLDSRGIPFFSLGENFVVNQKDGTHIFPPPL